MSKRHYRKEAKKRKRLDKRWRKPKGMHSKVRRKERYVQKMPNPGERTPKSKRHVHPCGLKEVLVNNVSELEKVNPKEFAVRFGKIGMKKKIELCKIAEKKGIKILNADLKKLVGSMKKKQEKEGKKREKKESALRRKETEKNIRKF